jgi:hypothetical protein
LIDVLPLDRTVAHGRVVAGIATALCVGALSADAVAARSARPPMAGFRARARPPNTPDRLIHIGSTFATGQGRREASVVFWQTLRS